jgi:acetyl/propionyl-CoA carboxylase alpha subunit
MNTRLQVEHPVTEMVTGVDLVKAQIQVAAGLPLPFKQSELVQRGWALECRIYAEDPAAGFVPAPGRINTLHLPDGPGVRVDAGVYEGSEVSLYYDPMIAKLAAWGRDRGEAIDRMRRALSECTISGELTTNLVFHRWIVEQPRFLRGDFDTNFINDEYRPAETHARGEDPVRLAALLAAAFTAQRGQNHLSTRTNTSVAAAGAASASAWKTLGRLDMLRR